jgi:hypothetical protein
VGRAGPLFSVGTFEGLRRVRLQRLQTPTLTFEELRQLIQRTDADAEGFDFDAAAALDEFVAHGAPCEQPQDFYRCCAFEVLARADMRWVKAITLGRQRFMALLDRDEVQCIRAAHLDAVPPPDFVIDWWDEITGYIRSISDAQKQERGRDAERLTMEYETNRLRQLGLQVEPKWVAIEDNTAGYDVLSYDPGPDGHTTQVIEVKSSVASPLRFFVSRNEWEKAQEFGDAYRFHIWDLNAEPPRLHIRHMAAVMPHIPTDQEKGRWATAVIPLSAQ